jgi:hypothetical protein
MRTIDNSEDSCEEGNGSDDGGCKESDGDGVYMQIKSYQNILLDYFLIFYSYRSACRNINTILFL